MELKTEGIVLKRYDKGENDNITVVFTKDAGKILFSSRGTKSAKSKLKVTLELFSLNKYFVSKKHDNSKYFTLIQAEPIYVFENIRTSLDKIGAVYYVLEITEKFMQLEEKNLELYDVLYDLLEGVNSGKYFNVKDIVNYYCVKVLKYSGFNISDDDDHFADLEISEGLRNYIKNVEEAEALSDMPASTEYAVSTLKMLDSYVTDILNEEVKSMKFLEKI